MATGIAGRLYDACRDGDIDAVEQLLRHTSIKDVNRLEADGKTCLHAASSGGHVEIVRRLLDHGASRQIRDRDGRTPSDVARNEEVATSYNRPEETVIERYAVDPIKRPNYLFGQDVAEAYSRAIHRGCIKDRGVKKTVEKFEKEQVVSKKDESKEGKLLRYFFNEAREKNDPTFFIRAYTVDSPFYRYINEHMASGSSSEVYEKLCHKWTGYYTGCVMKNSAFEPYRFAGVTYRGMTIDRDALKYYNRGEVLTNKAFQSTSKLRDVALRFAQLERPVLGKVSVFLQYTIVDRKSALDIKTLSEFPKEEEVLLVPGILFKVDYIDTTVQPCPIHLRQLPWTGQ